MGLRTYLGLKQKPVISAPQVRPIPVETKRWCVFCETEIDAWRPYVIKLSDVSDFLLRLDLIGSNIDRFGCPNCRSFDRERHLHLFLKRLGLLGTMAGKAVLHMSPEPQLSKLIEKIGPERYVKGDLSPWHASIQKMELERIPYPDGTFDWLLCNHMLEHVDEPRVALHEMHRVLKPGGRFICQTPYAAKLSKTFEDLSLHSPEDRLFFYGQHNHVRLFGADIEQIIRNAGFRGRLIPHEKILPGLDPERFGINEREPFFDFVRD